METKIFHSTIPGSRVLNSTAKEYFFDPLGFLELNSESDSDMINCLEQIAGKPGCPIYAHEGAKPRFENPVAEVPKNATNVGTGVLGSQTLSTTKV